MKLIVAALHDEVKDFLEDGYKLIVKKPYQLYRKNKTLVLVTGVGKVNASFSLTKVLDAFPRVDLIINTGFAGATKPFKVGEVVSILSTTYHDFDLTVFGYAQGQVPNLPVFYESDIKLRKLIREKYPVSEANLYTGDYFMSGADLRKGFVVDMEGAALYQVAHLSNIKIIAFKVVSDIVNADNQIDDYKKFEKDRGASMIKLALNRILEMI